MAFGKVLFLLFLVAVVSSHEVEKEEETQKAMASETGQQLRNANAERGSFHKLVSMMNRTDEKGMHRRGKGVMDRLHKINRKYNDMMNDNEGTISYKQKPRPDNDSEESLSDKIKKLRPVPPMFEAVYKNNYMSHAAGVFCGFDNDGQGRDMCRWQWNLTTSSHGLGFEVMTAADVVALNQTTDGLKFSGPSTDADGNVAGHFLYLAVDPTMGNMVVKSPIFRGLWEFCKFEVRFHQSKMQNASIRLVSESVRSGMQWILHEVAGNNFEMWHGVRFMIGKVLQEVRIILEISRPSYVSLSQTLPHVAIDNIRMVDCVPDPPECVPGQLECKIMRENSCIKKQQVCDLVKDCDDGSDENQNCDKMPYGSYCNFELDDCGFEDIPQPILKWSRHYGPTPTARTGPNYDHTCGLEYPQSTFMPPPLFPSYMNISIGQCVGYYFFVNMNVTGPNHEKADFASTAVMRTVVYNPPPKVHGNITSKYYNCCMIRFYYQQNGRNYGSLSVNVVELHARENITTSLWFSTKDKGENWYRATIFLPNITRRYYLEFKTRMGMRIYSDSAIDDYSMAPECFGLNIDPKELGNYSYYDYDVEFEEKIRPHPAFEDQPFYRLTTCGATGRFGPNQTMCDAAYNNTPVTVTVIQTPPYQGIQVWEVPAEGLYTLIATGASGGLGSAWAGVSHGAQTRALVELHRGERLYVLVGQQGMHACKKTLSAQESQVCIRNRTEPQQLYTSKTHEVRNTHVTDGGGGGGGGTFVFLLNKEGETIPLLVAGGGGGISVGRFRDDGSQHARPFTNSTPESGYMYGQPGKTSGAGGGWAGVLGPDTPGFGAVRGAALSEGGAGGGACVGPAHGGFGGGGGGCVRGGGGGGWLGGSTNEGSGAHGGGGWSYVSSTLAIREYSEAVVAAHSGPGELLILPAIHACGCDYRCVAMNEYRSEVKCYCPATWITDVHDPTKCILNDGWPRTPWVVIIILSIAVFVCALAILCVCLYLYNTYQRKKEAEQQQKRRIEQDVQLSRLRANPGDNLNMAFNPHYGSESILPQGLDVRGLPQVSRDSLKLVKALGQGAFGEVYQGLYRHRTGDTAEMPVAVKTLPELSTGQSESDFLMEAAIMAKFSHPNIVHLIGVCFDRHPRFIVLELLAGGDLKTFLRESRPKPERASALIMKDLLLCAIDVCRGCRYLESKRFIHRDIAARNCLLTSRGPGRVVKIADFGMARDIYRAEYYKKGGKAMLPIKWMPPEAFIDGVFTTKTDVWSFGILLWEVFSLGVMPYTGCSNREVMDMVTGGGRLDKPNGCPQEVYRLMCDCWNPIPLQRPSFAQMMDRLQRFFQDPAITSGSLPMMRSAVPAEIQINASGAQRAPAGDYLVPMSPADTPDTHNSQTEPLVPRSKSPTAAEPDKEDSQYPPHLKASPEYGKIPTACRSDGVKRDASATSAIETRTNTKFLQSNSTDRLLSSVEGASLDDETPSECDDKPVIWETSFTERPEKPEPRQNIGNGPVVEKLISITPTSPKPPENPLTPEIKNVIDKTNHKNSLVVEYKTAPIASPDPPRINTWMKEPTYISKPKPLCLDAAQLEQNLNALKKNSGSVNLTTMNILPPHINLVTPNKLSESKTIQIDPKKAVIDDLPKEKLVNEENPTLKQSNSAASLLNGPMTDVPYADSDNTSSSGSDPISKKYDEKNIVIKQGNGEYVGDSEISC